MVAIHERLHPVFTGDLEVAHEAYPEIRSADLITAVEIGLAQEDGHLVLMGIVKSSGSAIFDDVALAAMRRASPFGTPPPSIVSPDGNVYLKWEFHNDPNEACSTRNALPFVIVRPLR